ncbi:GIY-YIG nuclease family protein [Candidatus Pelagibacter sp.]|nr:GIY-YIG nuclease family protein [Candidatus Pelagibacter sp.]
MKGWIYIIQFGDRDLVKVGMSEGDSPLSRIKSLDSTSVSEPIKEQETYRVDNPREIEKFLHKKLIESNILKSRSDKFTEWFAGNFNEIKRIVEKNLNQIDIIKPDTEKTEFLSTFDGLVRLNGEIDFEIISKTANSKNWRAEIGLGWNEYEFKKLFYIFTYKNVYPSNYILRELNYDSLDSDEYEKFCEDFINKILRLNLKSFINNTSNYYPNNLLHLGCALFLINHSVTPLKDQLLINWNDQIQKMTHNYVRLSSLQYSNLNDLEKYIDNMGRQNRI